MGIEQRFRLFIDFQQLLSFLLSLMLIQQVFQNNGFLCTFSADFKEITSSKNFKLICYLERGEMLSKISDIFGGTSVHLSHCFFNFK